MWKQMLWTALLILSLIATLVLMLGGKSYYPVVKADSPDGITMTFISRPLNLEAGCRSKVGDSVKTLKENCPQCRIMLAGCPQSLEPAWDDALNERPVTLYAVHTRMNAILIEASDQLADQICHVMAESIAKSLSAHCTPPENRSEAHCCPTYE